MADGTITARFAIDVDQGRQSLNSLGPLAQQVGRQMAEAAGGASAAVDAQMAKYQRLGEQFQFMVRQQARQASVNADYAPGLTRSAPSASASASVFEEAAREQEAAARAAEQLTQRSNALRAALEPLFAAELRRNIELKEAHSLLAAGAISETTHAAAVARAQAAYSHAEAAALKHGKTVGLNTMQIAEFGHVGRAVIDSLAAGASPMQIAAFEGSRVAQALSEGKGGVGGSLKAIGGMVAPWAPLIAGVAVFGALTLAAVAYGEAQREAQAATEGWGRSSGASLSQINAIAAAASSSGEATASSARKVSEELLRTGQVGADALGPATDAILKFAKVTDQTADEAAKQLVPMFADPGQAADTLSDKLGTLTGAQVEHIKKLVEAGDRTQAQIEISAAFDRAIDTQADHIGGLKSVWDTALGAAARYFEGVGRFIDAQAGGGTAADKIAALEGELKAAKAGGHVQDGIDNDVSTRSVDAIQADIDRLRAVARTDAVLDRGRAEILDRNRRSKLVASDVDGGDTKGAQRRSLQEKLDRAKGEAADPDMLALGGRTKAQADAAVAGYEKQIAALDKSKTHHDGHAAAVARDSASIEANTRGALGSAAAYLRSTAEGQQADARRQASADAARKGVDLDTRVRQQGALADAQAAEAGAKATAQMRDQTDLRTRFASEVDAGRLSVEQAARAVQDEGQLAELEARRRAAARIGDIAGEQALREAIAARRQEQARAHAEDDRAQAQAAHAGSQERVRQMAEEARLAALGPSDPERLAIIRARAERSAAQALRSSADQRQAGDDAVSEEQARWTGEAATYAATATREYEKQRVLLQAQIAMAGVSVGQRGLMLADLAKRQELDANHLSASDAAGQKALAEARDLELTNQALARANAGYDEVRSQGDRLLDTTGTMFAEMDKGWAGMADTALSALKEIESELFKLALINPWKNSLFGENNPTIDSVGGLGGFFGKLFGLGGGINPAVASVSTLGGDLTRPDIFAGTGGLSMRVPGFATGTDNAPGGLARVGEQGEELVDLPRGARVIPHARSLSMMASASLQLDRLSSMYRAPTNFMPIGGSMAATSNVIVNDYRTTAAAAPQVRRDAHGNTHISLYDTAKKGMDSYVKGGDFERAARSTTSNVTKRA